MTADSDADHQLRRELNERHLDAYAWAMACCRHQRSDAEDVLQAAYLKVLEGAARFDGRSAFRTWLFGVIRRTAADHRRRRLMHTLLTGRRYAADPEPDPVRGADCHVEDSQLRRLCIRALAALSNRQREVLVLVFYHDMSVDEAARVMAISAGSARQHYARAKAQMRSLLNELEGGR
jgi:RNA polymerase sigma-70 factor (ECF subfamily)